MPWNLAQARLTCFFREPLENQKNDWWEEVLGVPPDESVTKRTEGIHTDKGIVNGRRLLLNIQRNKVDWLVSPVEQLSDELFNFIGTYDESTIQLRDMLQNWVSTAGQIKRIAIGAIALEPVEDRENGYRFLQTMLPALTIQPETSSDFFFQINRPTIGEFREVAIKINRLMKWSVSQVEFHRQNLAFNTGLESDLVASGHAARCELDISTDQDQDQEIDPAIRIDVLNRLFELGRSILQEGDVIS